MAEMTSGAGMAVNNALVEYVDESGKIVAMSEYYDPGLDAGSWYTREQKARGVWRGLHMAYGCGRPLGR